MARGDQLARQWSILSELAQGRRSRRALAEHFGVSLKTITRDIDALSHFPIVEEREGIDVIYHYVSSPQLPQLSLTAEERAALVLGKESALKAVEGAPFAPHFQSALSKVERLQQDSTYHRVRDLPRDTHRHNRKLSGKPGPDLSRAYPIPCVSLVLNDGD